MPVFNEDFYSRRARRPAGLSVDQKLDLLLEWMQTMSQGFDDLTAAIGDLTTAVGDESDQIAKNTDAINTENGAITAATTELTTLVGQLQAAQGSGDDAAAETAAQAIEAQVAKMKTSSGNIAASTAGIATSTTTLNDAVTAATSAAAAAPAPAPGNPGQPAPASPPPPPAPAPSPVDPDPAEGFAATVGVAFSEQLDFEGGSGALQFSIASGALPDGLTMGGGGLVTGTPTTAGTGTVSIQAHDANNDVGAGSYVFTVANADGTPAVPAPTATTDDTVG